MDSYLADARKGILNAVEGLRPDDLARRPEGKWSIAEILEHLTLAFTSTSGVMKTAINKGISDVSPPTWKQRIVTGVVVGIGYMPTGRPAPSWTIPKGTPADVAIQECLAGLEEMRNVIGDCEKKYGSAIVALHPIIGPLTAKQWRKFHYVHTRHHMQQVLARKQRKI